MNILIINGPNLNFLGLREPEVYGAKTYSELLDHLNAYANEVGVNIEIHQTNHEGVIIDLIQYKYREFQGLIINPGAYTHYSYAIYDCIKSIPLPTVEVHLSDISQREEFRKKSVIEPACVKQISSKGFQSYTEAIDYLKRGYEKK
ncbi:MAG: 3-dehydroquinate dehydratase [Bacilli bacterium]|nr:3-dehydroquinate dehydratase [Bacilli bacterium]